MAKSSPFAIKIHYNVTKYNKKSQKKMIFFLPCMARYKYSEMHAQIKVLILFRDVEHDTRK
jgi:hypothetical protein